MELRKELHETKALLRQAQGKMDRIKKDGAPLDSPSSHTEAEDPQRMEDPHINTA